ncbi:hypothetical protein Vadar_017478 [Vaccinium darrowii]|uniref:Uncharacterized protein n=1 Tax=Vaccinium darrowii TaxID=229202 RepID=A0ACB7X1N7_9ERIC|nr:hypothetical protein Vadar_017478 [Vaccinium darrowii]
MEIDNDVKREEIEKLVLELMGGDKGKKMKKKAMEWKELAEKAAGPNGSSSLNLEKLVNQKFIGFMSIQTTAEVEVHDHQTAASQHQKKVSGQKK